MKLQVEIEPVALPLHSSEDRNGRVVTTVYFAFADRSRLFVIVYCYSCKSKRHYREEWPGWEKDMRGFRFPGGGS
jgi:hypothetical protein